MIKLIYILFLFSFKMEHDYANYFGRVRSHPNRRRLSLGMYQNQDFFSTTINESSGGEDFNANLQNRDNNLSNNNFQTFPERSFDFPQNRPPEQPEFSSQSSREWDQNFSSQGLVFRKVSFTEV